ncbi:MAG: replicative DNA helicase, partial [Planctomycetales bacterium]|nr:replicative DNA helicase [Planctomycetales bacterium]
MASGQNGSGDFSAGGERKSRKGKRGRRFDDGQDEDRDVLDQLADRQIPHSLEAERAVIGSILLLPEVFDDVALAVRPDDFYDEANRIIYQHLLEMHDSNASIDLMLLVERLRQAEAYDRIGGAAYLATIGNEVPTAAHAVYYGKIVAEKALLRSLITASTEILRDAYDPTADTRHQLSRAEERVFGILEERGGATMKNIADVLQESLDRLDRRMNHDVGSTGVETGLDDFDQMTGGLQKSELVILAARPSMGKTALAMNMAEHAAIHVQAPVFFVSLEMAAAELGDRLLCSVAEVNGSRLRNGTITQEERRKIVDAAGVISQAPLFVDDTPSRTMTEIAANARRIKRRQGLGLIVIDYLQLI